MVGLEAQSGLTIVLQTRGGLELDLEDHWDQLTKLARKPLGAFMHMRVHMWHRSGTF